MSPESGCSRAISLSSPSGPLLGLIMHRRTVRLLAPIMFLVLLSLLSCPAGAWESLDVEAMLRRPGVKLVAVEFYATWCKPCNDSIPQWKRLQETYWEQGLRLIVVSVQSGGQCVSPGWVPDQVVCDDEGRIQQRWGAQTLPQAFLWSWQGHLLSSHAGVEQVAQAVRRYLGDAPRILVDEPTDGQGHKLDKEGRGLREQVQAELGRSAKFDLVVGPGERKRLEALLRESQRDVYAEGCKVAIGEALPPNTLLRIVQNSDPGARQGGTLGLNLISVRTGCSLGASRVALGRRAPEQVVAEAVDQLLQPLSRGAILPEGPPRSFDAEAGPSRPPSNVQAPPPPDEPTGYLSITGQPDGATLRIEGPPAFNGGRALEERLPLLPPREVPAGKYSVTASAPGHEKVKEERMVAAKSSVTLELALQLETATLLLSGEPARSSVTVRCGADFAKKPAGVIQEPFGLPEQPFALTVPRGPCRVRVTLTGWQDFEEVVNLAGGEERKLHVKLRQQSAEPPEFPDQGTAQRTLSRDDIAKVVKENKWKIQNCYERQSDPKLSGTIMISFVVQRTGLISSASIRTSSFEGTPVGQCMLSAVRSFVFPIHDDPPVKVNYPFILR